MKFPILCQVAFLKELRLLNVQMTIETDMLYSNERPIKLSSWANELVSCILELALELAQAAKSDFEQGLKFPWGIGFISEK